MTAGKVTVGEQLNRKKLTGKVQNSKLSGFLVRRSLNPMASGPHHGGLRVVALFEGAKGALVLVAGFGLLSLIHEDV